jgi:hypothetical protein
MTAITHTEVRRHPRWRAELSTPHASAPRTGARLIGTMAILIVTTAIGVLLLAG